MPADRNNSDARDATDVTVYETEYEMRFGPRSYTDEQAKFIADVVANRKPLPACPVDLLDEDEAE